MKIVSAALCLRNGLILTLPKPARHCDIIRLGISAGLYPPLPGGRDGDGFLTNEGHYVTRAEAEQIAIISGQIESHQSMIGSRLTSEDLW